MDIVSIINIVAVIVALLVAIIGHEIMHGRMAFYYGDTTAKEQDRFSINPITHIDPIGTIAVPAMLYFADAGFMFGWAKPVPVNMSKVFQNGGHIGGINVALAGIYYNFIIAILALVALKILPHDQSTLIGLFMVKTLFYLLIYNVILGTFNLFPLPPLDGSKALMFILSKLNFHKLAKWINQSEKYGMLILMLIIATPLSQYVFAPIQAMVKLFLSL